MNTPYAKLLSIALVVLATVFASSQYIGHDHVPKLV